MKLIELAPITGYPFCAKQELEIVANNLRYLHTIFYQKPFEDEFSQSVVNSVEVLTTDGKKVIKGCSVSLFDKETGATEYKYYLFINEDFIESDDNKLEEAEKQFLIDVGLDSDLLANWEPADENWRSCVDPRLE